MRYVKYYYYKIRDMTLECQNCGDRVVIFSSEFIMWVLTHKCNPSPA